MTRNILAILMLSVLCACVSMHHDRGYMAKFSNHEKILPGKTTKEGVQAIMGSPSSRSGFGAETWYYISMRTEQKAFLEKNIAEQKIISVSFSKDNIVSDVKINDGSDIRNIEIADDVTPTEGHDLGVMEQLLGNLGRFNTE